MNDSSDALHTADFVAEGERALQRRLAEIEAARDEALRKERLADSAPELLKALEALVRAARMSRLTDGHRSVECVLIDEILAADVAIAKATRSTS